MELLVKLFRVLLEASNALATRELVEVRPRLLVWCTTKLPDAVHLIEVGRPWQDRMPHEHLAENAAEQV